MSSIRPVKCLVALLVILAGGLARLPLEQAFAKDLRAAELAEEPLNLSLRDELGQSFFIAVLGGFRSLVASLIEMENLDDWQHQNWAKVDAAYAMCNRLQPREHHYWDFRVWMSAYNAFDYYKYQDLSRPGLKPWIRQNLIDHSIDVLKEGMQHLPKDYRLPRTLARLMSDFGKNQHADDYEAAQWYYKAWQLRPKYRMLWRNYVYCLARAPGHELEAWQLLMEAYHSGPLDHPDSDYTKSMRTAIVMIYDKVKALRPDTVLPEDLVKEREQLLKAEADRQEKNAKRRILEEAEIKEMEAEELRLKSAGKSTP